MRSENELEAKIFSAMERLFTAYRVVMWKKIKETRLSPIQFQFLLYLRKKPASVRNVSSLALEFGLTKATVSKAVNSLIRKKLVYKEKNKKDNRISILTLSSQGKKLAPSLEVWDKPIKKNLTNFRQEEKIKLFLFLINLLDLLRKDGIIKVARMCVSCSNFKRNAFPGRHQSHFCSLKEKPIADEDLQVDCSYHLAFSGSENHG